MGLDTNTGVEVHLCSGGPRHSPGPAGLGVLEEAGCWNFRQRWLRGIAGEGLAIAMPLAVVLWALCKSETALP